MIELSPQLVTILMLGGALIGVLTGFPLAIVIGGVTAIVGYILYGDLVGGLVYPRALSLLLSYPILAVPSFIIMGLMLERSGITERLYESLYLLLGGFRGGLAVVTVLIGTIMAACVGIIAASITMLALVAFPSMIKRGYDKNLAAGSIISGGCLGILIPPSIMLVIYGPAAEISVGKLFMGAFGPGLLLSALYMIYIWVRAHFQPAIAPVVPVEERQILFSKKIVMLLTSLAPPVLLILAVLGTIYLGIAPPTEASALGAFVATLMALSYRRLNWQVLKGTLFETIRLCGFIYLIGAMSFAFVGVFIRAGCNDVIRDIILATPMGKWGGLLVIMFIVFLLGFFIDWIGIVFIMVPIIMPVISSLGFDPLWFSILICVNLQTAFMTPPFAPGIFVLAGAVDPKYGLTMSNIIRGVIPFVILVFVVIALCVAFPQIVLWLPGKMVN